MEIKILNHYFTLRESAKQKYKMFSEVTTAILILMSFIIIYVMFYVRGY